MKKKLFALLLIVTFCVQVAVPAAAARQEIIKVGLRWADTALFSANLENAVGEGYEFGYYDEDRDFEAFGWTDETAISMTAAGTIYMNSSGAYASSEPNGSYEELGPWRVQVDGFDDYDEAEDYARDNGGWPAWIDFEFVARFGCFESRHDAEDFADELGEGDAVKVTDTGIVVTVTRTEDVIFEFDAVGEEHLGVLPAGGDEDAETWFKGYKYTGGFEYRRAEGDNLSVINVLDLESYVKGVIPYEMNGDWPLEALKAQAVCARTYACRSSKHLGPYGFDVCNTTDCQVYYGTGSGGAAPSKTSDRAVEKTEGEKLYYEGDLVQNAVYHSSNGGATEDCANVWGSDKGYLQGKEDPFEGEISIPNYAWSVTYTADELTWILEQKDYDIGTVKDVYVSEYTDLGNVREITFEGSRKDLVVTGETCRTIFYSSTYGKSVKSMRFGVNGSMPVSGGKNSGVYVNDDDTKLKTLEGVSVLSGKGTLTTLEGDSFTVLTAEGTNTVTVGGKSGTTSNKNNSKKGVFVIEGMGSGHNLGLSQYGAKAMAEAGYDYDEILEFYFTDITIE